MGDELHVAYAEVMGHGFRVERPIIVDEHGDDHRLQRGELQALLEKREGLLGGSERLFVELAPMGCLQYSLQSSDDGVVATFLEIYSKILNVLI